jgi:hypothetical protein
MKRRFSWAACVLAGVLLLTACGNGGTDRTDPSGQNPPTGAATTEGDPQGTTGALVETPDEYFIWTSDPTFLSGLTEEGKKLKEVVVPAKAKKIRTGAFRANTTIERVAFAGDNIEFEGTGGPFSRCSSLRWVQLPPELEVLPPSSFSGCDALETVIMPSELREIGKIAFADCASLKTVTLGKAETIGEHAFMGCEALTEITIPETMQTIKEEAFFNCRALETIQFDGVVTIEKRAFYQCYALKRVELPETLRELGDAAFANNKSLEAVRLPASLETIGNVPFAFCPLTTIEVKEGSVAAAAMLEDYANDKISYV